MRRRSLGAPPGTATAGIRPGRSARLYCAVVRRVHPFVVRTVLRRFHRRLALAAPSAGERPAARG
ncbi:hypothetical protein OHS81_05615 [Streptomyces sp. NBC_00400]|uniref:hypothetical protein n=1 Tax=Streptomyces sp. NBC_00400 TaxID=2975737 RepID=UPI002E2061A2